MAADLKWSITNGDCDAVQSLIDTDPKLINCDINGRRPLHFAADFGQNDVAKYLIRKGADINAVDVHGITPLLAAIFENHVSTVKLLLESGARKDLKGPDGQSYVDCADSTDIKKLLC